MVHHTEWDRKIDQQGGYMQKDHNEMEKIIKEMAPGGKHYHAFKDGSVKTDAQILSAGSSHTVHKGAPYDSSLPSFNHGQWYHSTHSTFINIMFFIVLFVVVVMVLKAVRMAKRHKRKSSRSRSKSRK